MHMQINRRRFIKGLGAALGVAATTSTMLRKWMMPDVASAVHLATPANFLVLDEDERVPVRLRRTGGYPIMEAGGTPADAPDIRHFDLPSALAKDVPFPVYEIDAAPSLLTRSHVEAMRNQKGQVVSAVVAYSAMEPTSGERFTVADVSATEVYTFPMPVRATRVGDVLYPVDVVDYLPKTGVHRVSASGHLFHWMEDGILYSLRAEYREGLADAVALASRLRRVGA